MKSYFVIDNKEYKKRVELNEPIPFGHLALYPDLKTKELEQIFIRQVRGYDSVKFKKFILFQLQNSPNQNEFIDFLNYSLIPSIKQVVANWGSLEGGIKKTAVYSSIKIRGKTKIKIINKVIDDFEIDSTRTTKQNTASRIAYFAYFMSNAKIKFVQSNFPSSEAWIELSKKYERSPKNIQQSYNLIIKDSLESKSKTKIDNIEYVIKNLIQDYPKAIKLAKDQLNKVKSKL